MICIKLDDDYTLVTDRLGDMLVMKVVHKLTGVVCHTKRKRVINDLQIKSELYKFREFLFERNGLKQVLLNELAKRHGVDPEGKDLRTILDEVKAQQDKKGYFDVTREEAALINQEVNENGKDLDTVIKQMGIKRK